jgi:hypothetical protein
LQLLSGVSQDRDCGFIVHNGHGAMVACRLRSGRIYFAVSAVTLSYGARPYSFSFAISDKKFSTR